MNCPIPTASGGLLIDYVKQKEGGVSKFLKIALCYLVISLKEGKGDTVFPCIVSAETSFSFS